jgi:hypothetical protein
MTRLVLVIAVLMMGMSQAGAQPQPQKPAAANQGKRERVKKRIQALRAFMLIDQLGLDEQTAAKVLLVFSKYDEEFEKALAERADLQRKLGAITEKDAKAAVDSLVDQATSNGRAVWDIDARRLAELRKLLTPAQTAHLIVQLPLLEKRIQNQLRRAIQGAGPGPRAKEPGRPDFGEDDDDDDGPPVKPRPR